MNRILLILREQLADAVVTDDRHLLDRFLTVRDESAFAELVRRYGPLVWGVCRRRLANLQDAEDAFQATFLVLVRRAESLDGHAPIGPWLYKVAAMTARNVLRGNRRRTAITGPMEHDVPAPSTSSSAELIDLDAALLALPERDRVAVVLCHLQGLSRREAAERLGCAEGTLSARLSRALQKLRGRLGDELLAVLAIAVVAMPASLASATTRAAIIYLTSNLTAAGVSPTVVGLTNGVLRMFWMKKVTAAVMVLLAVGVGVLALSLSGRGENAAHATEPLAPDTPPSTPETPDALKRLEKRQAELEMQKVLLDAALVDLKTEKQKLEEARKAKVAAAELGESLEIVVTDGGRGLGWGKPPYTVREVVNGKIGEMYCYDLDILTTYLTRTTNDPKAPKNLRIRADMNWSHDQVFKLFAACAQAGYKKARFILPEAPLIVSGFDWKTGKLEKPEKVERGEKEKEIDLTKYAEPKKP